jgi:phospholipid-binding lipoprotein MlaA
VNIKRHSANDLRIGWVLRELFLLWFLLLWTSIQLTGCVAANKPPPPPEDHIWDPAETLNRGIFEFNDTLDRNVLEPVARGYDWAIPEFVQQRIRNVFDTLAYPKYVVNDLIQLKFVQAAEHTGRVFLNLTAGVAGLFDVATEVGLPRHVEDFGTSLGYHGVPAGPYLMLPFLGPSTVRDLVGRVVDGFLDPLNLIFYTDIFSDDESTIISFAGQGLWILQTRADLVEAIETGRKSSIDYYLFAQAAYYQYRLGLVYEGQPELNEDEEFGDETFGEGAEEDINKNLND